MRALREALPAAALAARSAKIVERVLALPEWQAAKSVALYAAMPGKGEVDPSALDADARRRALRVYYPFMDPIDAGYRTGFRQVASVADLAERGRRFLEPPPEAPVAEAGDVDLVLVPALAVSADGRRLGWGAGFYDATLPDVCPPALAVVTVFDFQLLPELPTEPHDQHAAVVVTDLRVLRQG